MSQINMIYVPNEVLSIVIGNVPYVVQAAHPNFKAVVEAAKSNDPEQIALIPELVNIAKAVALYTAGKITVDVDNGLIIYNGEVVHNYVCDRIIAMMEDGFDVDPMVQFLGNLMQNPSKRAVDELYGFLEFGKMPITPDGHFLAYKRVQGDYKSVHDGKTDNSIGAIVEMPRNKVSDNKDQTCSYGLHFCSVGYLGSYNGEKIVVLKINPRDVVSIPTDYNNTKGRACRYEVVGELTFEQVEQATGGSSVWNTSVVDTYEEHADVDFDLDDNDVELNEEYQNGYTDAQEDFAEHDLAEYIESNGTDYQDGYVDGWADALENDAALDPSIDDGGLDESFWVSTTVDESSINDSWNAGYDIGYEHGRKKMASDQSLVDGPYKDGYVDGYKDGKGHKSRRV